MCSVVSGTPPFNFKWEKNGHHVENDYTLKISHLDDMSVLTIERAAVGHSGNFTCIVENPFGRDQSHASLTVNGMFTFMHPNPND